MSSQNPRKHPFPFLIYRFARNGKSAGSVFTLLLALLVPGMAHGQEALPRHVDLKEHELVTRVQGKRDTCSLFAITAVAEMECARQSPQRPRRLSEEFLIWAGNEASGLKGDQAMFYKAVNGLNRFGICTEEMMPYVDASDPARRPSAKALADARERSRAGRSMDPALGPQAAADQGAVAGHQARTGPGTSGGVRLPLAEQDERP